MLPFRSLSLLSTNYNNFLFILLLLCFLFVWFIIFLYNALFIFLLFFYYSLNAFLLLLLSWKRKEMFSYFPWSYYGTSWARIWTFWKFLRKYVATKVTATLKKSYQFDLEHYFEENEFVIQVVIAHFVPILKYRNHLTELIFLR